MSDRNLTAQVIGCEVVFTLCMPCTRIGERLLCTRGRLPKRHLDSSRARPCGGGSISPACKVDNFTREAPRLTSFEFKVVNFRRGEERCTASDATMRQGTGWPHGQTQAQEVPHAMTQQKRPAPEGTGLAAQYIYSMCSADKARRAAIASLAAYSAMKSRWTLGSTLTPGPMVELSAMLFT